MGRGTRTSLEPQRLWVPEAEVEETPVKVPVKDTWNADTLIGFTGWLIVGLCLVWCGLCLGFGGCMAWSLWRMF